MLNKNKITKLSLIIGAMNKRQFVTYLALGIAGALVLALGLWWFAFHKPLQPTLTKVRLGYLPSLAAAQTYVAVQNGLFAKQGLDVELTEIYSGPEVIQTLQARSIDIGFGVLPTVALARGKQVLVRSLVGATTDSGTIREHRLIVAKNSPIQSAIDLRGRRIALVAEPTSDGLALFEYLEGHGLSRADVTLIKTPHPEMLIAVSGGSVDAAAGIEPFISEGRLAGKTRELVYYYPEGVTEVGTYIVHEDWLRVNTDVAMRFANAIREATRWINDDTDRLRALLPRLHASGIRFKISEQAARELHLPGFREEATDEGVRELIRLLQKYGFLQEPLDPATILPVHE